jgi:C4-dicarboxylate transporter DctM subunit
MALFMGYTAIWSLLNPDKMPPAEPPVPFLEKIYRSRRLIPVALLIGSVVGSIYGGIATPTEAATIGVIGGADPGRRRRRLDARELHGRAGWRPCGPPA